MFKLVSNNLKINAICYTVNVNVFKFCTGSEGSEDSRNIAITFLTAELEGWWSTTFQPQFIYCIGVG